jgi:hypothetical protein
LKETSTVFEKFCIESLAKLQKIQPKRTAKQTVGFDKISSRRVGQPKISNFQKKYLATALSLIDK